MGPTIFTHYINGHILRHYTVMQNVCEIFHVSVDVELLCALPAAELCLLGTAPDP